MLPPGGRKWQLIYPKYELPKFVNMYVNVKPDCLLGLTNLFLLQLLYMFFLHKFNYKSFCSASVVLSVYHLSFIIRMNKLPVFPTCGQCYKTLYGRKLRIFVISQSICTTESLSSLKLCLWIRQGAYPTVEHLKGACASLRQAPALPANISLGWKGFPGTNALAYYKNSYLTAVKSFITLAPGVNFTNIL